MTTFKTPKGKTIQLYNEGMSVCCKFVEGGALPASLAGKWTDSVKATDSINKYLNDMEPIHIQEKDENGIFKSVNNPNKNKAEE
jgi:hypothetical protein